MKRVRANVSLGLLVAALMLFLAFHFLPGGDEGEHGWMIWQLISEIIHMLPTLLSQPQLAMIIASFLTFTVLVVASPMLTNVWTKSRLAWAIATLFSGLVAASFWIIACYSGRVGELSKSEWCLLFATLLNFAGLLLARSRRFDSTGSTTAQADLSLLGRE